MNQHAKRRYQHEVFGSKAAPKAGADVPAAAKARTNTGPGLAPGLHAFIVEAAGRLDKFLVGASDGFSRTRVKSLVEAGHVRVDGVTIIDASLKVRAGQEVAINAPAPAPAEPEGENIPLDVVHEDDQLIVINKPAGLVVHPAAGHETGTLVNALIAHCGDSLSGVGGVRRPGIVHRLDKDTSGLLLVAKTDQAHQALSALFADHGRELHLVRDYVAFVWGTPDRPAGVIDAPLGRHQWHREKQAVVSGDRGRFAITHFAVEQVYRHAGKPIASRVRCRLETGRTHQIRVHLAHIGCPVMGDPLYGAGFRTKAALLPQAAQKIVERLRRQALHATSLGFEHPATGEQLLFGSPLPDDLAELAAALEG